MLMIPARFYRHTARCRNAATSFLLVLVCFTGCQEANSIEGVDVQNVARLRVNVFTPQRIENAAQTAYYFGKLRANRSETLGFPVGGKLSTTPDAQQKFAAGATIATLDAEPLTNQLAELEQQLAATSPANQTNRRYVELQDQITELQTQIEQRSILAPFGCIVERTFASPNSLVRRGAAIVSVVETTSPKIEINLPRRIVKLIDINNNYFFDLDGQQIETSVRERAFTENPPGSVRMVFDIETSLAEIDFYLDQTVEIQFSFPTNQSGYWLPMSSLQKSSDDVWSVLVVATEDERQKVRRQTVSIAQIRDDSVLVTNDFEEQMIVRDGVHRVVPGQTVDTNLVSLEKNAAADAGAAP